MYPSLGKYTTNIALIIIFQFCFSGFSHRPEYHLFRLGESASLAVKQFAEQGATDILDKQKVQNINGQITRDKGQNLQ